MNSSTGHTQTLHWIPVTGRQKPPFAEMGTKATVLCNDRESSWASLSAPCVHPDLQDTSLGWKRGQFISQTKQAIQSTTCVLWLLRVPISGSCIGGVWDADSWLLGAEPRQPSPSTWKQEIKKEESNILFSFWVISFIYFHCLCHFWGLSFFTFLCLLALYQCDIPFNGAMLVGTGTSA